MIRKFLLVLLLLLAPSFARAQGLTYGTYFGGSGLDTAHGIALDKSNDVFVTGFTQSTNFPVKNAIQNHLAGKVNAFVSEFSSTGTLLWSTYFGGSQLDRASDIATDSSGNLYVVGTTSSPDFPVTAGVVQPTFTNGTNAFVSKFTSGGKLIWSTYLGATPTEGNSIAIDSQGNVFVAGDTNTVSNQDGFVTELNSTATKIIFTRTIGGSGTDSIRSIALLGEEAYVVGFTNSTDFPATPGAFQRSCGTSCSPYYDGFVAELGSSGVAYATYLGGNTTTAPGTTMTLGIGIAVDAGGNAYVTGTTNTIDFPISSGAFQKVYGGTTLLPGGLAGCIDFISGRVPCGDAFLTKLNSTGTAIVYSTYLGGTTADIGYNVVVEAKSGAAWVAGYTQSSFCPKCKPPHFPFPTTADAYQTIEGGGLDSFITEVAPNGSSLIYSTYYGGNNDEEAFGFAVDLSGNVYIAGRTISFNSPVSANAFQPTFQGGVVDAFIVKITP
jgi:Beta-propeller repeat